MVNQNALIQETDGLTRLTFDITGDVVVSMNIAAKNNLDESLAPVEVVEKSFGYNLVYDIGDMISLAKYLRQNEARKVDLIRILKTICETIMKARERHLYPENFAINVDLIFINRLKARIKMIYLPFETGESFPFLMKAFLTKMFGELLIVPDAGETDYINRLMNYYKQPHFDLNGFYELLNEIGAPGEQAQRKSFFSRLKRKKRKEQPQPRPIAPIPEPSNETRETPRNGTQVLVEGRDKNSKRPPRRVILTCKTGSLEKRMEMTTNLVKIGRDPSNDFAIVNDDYLSRLHAELSYEDGKFILTNLSSKNGTRYLESLVREPTEISLPADIVVGSTTIHISFLKV